MQLKAIMQWIGAGLVGISVSCGFAANSMEVPIHLINVDGSEGKKIGIIKIEPAKDGVLLTPALHGLTPGEHGFHIHENASCGRAGMAAGNHLDPEQFGVHNGPYNMQSHLGDLPVLYVNADGAATASMMAPRLKISDLMQHAFIIHEHGDNYSDEPEKLGGGGKRIACGVLALNQDK